MIDIRLIEDAYDRVKIYIKPTRLEKSISLCDGNTTVYMKMECEQPFVKSFKIRGVLAKLTSINMDELQGKETCAISAGNQGVSLAYCSSLLNLPTPHIFAPTTVSKTKIEKISQLGGQFELVGANFDEAHAIADKIIEERGYCLIDAREDIDGVVGQGTIGVELVEQLDNIDNVIVPKGSGALSTSIASYLKQKNPHIKTYAVEPEYSAALTENLKTGIWTYSFPVTDNTDPLLKSLIGGCAELSFKNADALEDILLVNDDEVKNAWNKLLRIEKVIVEPDSAATYAAFVKYRHLFEGQNTVLVLSGANIDDQMFDRLYR